MTFTDVLVPIAILGFVLSQKVKGQPVHSRRLIVLPVVLSILGLQTVAHAKLGTTDIVVVAAGSALSFVLGALRGHFDKLSLVDGSPWVSWGATSVAVFGLNVVLKLALDAIGVAAGGSTAGLSKSLVLAAGLTLLGEAAMVWWRAQSAAPGTLCASGTASGRGSR